MKQIKILWKGGPSWDPTKTSSINPDKKKSAVEHLIETGGQTIDETITSIQKFSVFPLDVKQEKSTDENINWITYITIKDTESEMADYIRNLIVDHYRNKQEWLKSSNTGYELEIQLLDV